MKVLLTILFLATTVAVANAQPPLVVTPTTHVTWESEDYHTVFGTIPVVSSYIGEFWLRSKVVNGEPVGPPEITVDWGKPAVDAANIIQGPPFKALLKPNVEYIAFVRATGFATGILESSERSNPTNPFGFPSAPKRVVLTVTP